MSNDDATWTDHRDELFERVVQQGRARKRRRALTTVGVVVVVGAVAAFGLYAPGRGHDSVHIANDPNRGTTTTLPARPAGVLLIGDQVMLGAKSALVQAIPEARVDAGVSRQLDQAAALVNADKQSGALPPTIVIGLGTNGPSEGDPFDRVTTDMKSVMDAIGSKSVVYFVSVKVPRAWESEVNAALYSEVTAFPNAHILAWKEHSGSHADWFLADGIHLSPAGQLAYAAFVRDGIRTPTTTYSDPFAGRAIPSTGFIVTDDAKGGGEHASPSYAMEVYDDAGNALGPLPRAVIDYHVTNDERHQLVVTDAGMHLEPLPIAPTTDEPDGCTPTEKDDALAVADCGARIGDQVLGNRIVANDGSGWAQVIGKPPVQGGSPLVGHWVWAWPSPNGRWIAAQWSAECEVPVGFVVSVADGSVRTVTGEVGAAWGDGPESSVIGWQADGSVMGIFGGDTSCGTSAPVQRGIYLVNPDTGARRLLLPLTPSQGVLTWSAVADQRRLAPVPGSPLAVDLDGDGRADQLQITAASGGQSAMIATLANGRVASGTLPSGYSVSVLGSADIAGDGRHEVFVRNGGETWTIGEIVMLDGNQLIAAPGAADAMFPLGWDQHTNSDPRGTSDVACLAVDGHPSLVITTSSVSPRGNSRDWRRSVFTLRGTEFVRQRQDSGTLSLTATPPADLPLANRLDCGDAHG